jgi:hypothetical protein
MRRMPDVEKMKEEKSMQELHEIRSRHYEATKRLTSAELAESINKEASEVEREILSVRENRATYGDARKK